ncbi:hypothetical protein [Spirosoma montaniterrae]|uniref:Lipocalin-like domain-containing protein n=1 Tax=Spirosoma montaniterrae TaxID=1178516 RepID=A0A1P9WU41_9BACT|nr:hypothetical protein [Spirosoma montaniterrae]AQG78879.1 hypothetical protein AWR27_05795 [Spirosoma montaniterrae]
MKTLLLLVSLLTGYVLNTHTADYSGNWYSRSNGITMQLQQHGTVLSCHFRTADYTHEAEGPVWVNASGRQVGRWLVKRTAPDGCITFIDCRITFLSDTQMQISASAVDTNCDLPATWRETIIYERQ